MNSSRRSSVRGVLALLALVVAFASSRHALAQPPVAQPSVQPSATQPTTREPTSLFRHEAAIESVTGSLVRLPIPPDVLREARSDLADLRIHDGMGSEVPYAIDRGTRVPTETRSSAPTVVVPFQVDEHTERGAHGAVTSFESYSLRPPHRPTAGGVWEVWIETDRADFVRQVRATTTTTNTELGRGAFFRFLGRGERIAMRLPGLLDDAFTLELVGEGAALHPRFLLREVERDYGALPTAETPLTIRAVRREGTSTILEVERPRGLETTELRLASSTGSFVRGVEVRSTTAANGRVVLGHGTLVRLVGVDAPELLAVPLGTGGGDVLEVVVDDGDSAPLEGLTARAVVRVPTLVFDGRDGLALRWGAEHVRAPHYDLMQIDLAAIARRAAVEGMPLPIASLAEPHDNPGFDATPALAFAMRAGEVVSLRAMTHRASLEVPADETASGLGVARCPIELASHGRVDLADLRIVDASGHQWPYLLELAPSPESLTATVTLGEPEGTGVSHHDVALPFAVAPTSLSVEARGLVSRVVEVFGTTEEGVEVSLGSAYWQSAENAATFTVPLTGQRVERLWIRVEDGSETPLALDRAVLAVPASDLYVVAPPGTYDVVVGDRALAAPRYDLESARALVLALTPTTLTIGAVAPNPAYQAPSLIERSGFETLALSAVLALVVLVLVIVTLRVVRDAVPAKPSEPETKASESTAKASEPTAKPSEPETPSETTAKASEPETPSESTAEAASAPDTGEAPDDSP